MSMFPFEARPDEVVLVDFRRMTLNVDVQMHMASEDDDQEFPVVAYREMGYRPSTFGAVEFEQLAKHAAFMMDPG